MERPIEKMLHPKTMHDYCELAGTYGFTPYENEDGFDQATFLKRWNELKRNAKKTGSYQRVREKYPEILQNKKGTSRISIYDGSEAVYPLVQNLTPIYSYYLYGFVMPVYAPGWKSLSDMYISPEPGMRRMQENDVVKYLEWTQQYFNFFDILQKKQQHLDIMLLDDLDTTSEGGSTIALTDWKTKKIRLGIVLSFCDPKKNENSYMSFDNIFFHELCHLLYCLAYDTETSDKVVPNIVDFLGNHDFFNNYNGLSQTQKHEVAVNFLNEGMLSGTEYEHLFCPRKNDSEFIALAKIFFQQIIAKLK